MTPQPDRNVPVRALPYLMALALLFGAGVPAAAQTPAATSTPTAATSQATAPDKPSLVSRLTDKYERLQDVGSPGTELEFAL